jgi:hypothetical protein
MTKEKLAQHYMDADDYKIRCAAIDRDAEDLVKNAFIAGYEAGHGVGFESAIKIQEQLGSHTEQKLIEQLFVNVEPLLKGK